MLVEDMRKGVGKDMRKSKKKLSTEVFPNKNKLCSHISRVASDRGLTISILLFYVSIGSLLASLQFQQLHLFLSIPAQAVFVVMLSLCD